MSKTTYVDIEDRYHLKTDNEEVNVDVIIGNAQPGAYSIFLNSKLVGQNKPIGLGKASSLANKKLLVSVVVQDERVETNWTSAEIVIKEGSNKISYGPYSKEVNEHLDTIIYTIKITLEK